MCIRDSIATDLRARCRELRGPFFRPDPGYYGWLSERLYRFGRERATGRVIADFLGRPLSPRSLIQDLGRADGHGHADADRKHKVATIP